MAFDYVSPINEPTWDWNQSWQEGNRYNNDDLKQVILELYRQLQHTELQTRISAPDGVEITSLLDDEYYRLRAVARIPAALTSWEQESIGNT